MGEERYHTGIDHQHHPHSTPSPDLARAGTRAATRSSLLVALSPLSSSRRGFHRARSPLLSGPRLACAVHPAAPTGASCSRLPNTRENSGRPPCATATVQAGWRAFATVRLIHLPLPPASVRRRQQRSSCRVWNIATTKSFRHPSALRVVSVFNLPCWKRASRKHPV